MVTNQGQEKGKELKPRQKKFLAAMLSEKSMRAAAEKAGISYPTARRWMLENANFKAAYSACLDSAVSESLDALKMSLLDATNTLREVCSSPDAPDQTRVAAAKAIIEGAVKLSEYFDIEKRVAALEEMADKDS